MKAMLKVTLGILIVFVIVGCQSSLTSSRQSNTDGKGESADAAADPDEHDGVKNGNQEITTHPGYEPPVPIILTEKADYPLPAGCSPRQAAAIVATFVEAFNEGDQELLDRIFQSLPESRLPDWAGQHDAFSYFLSEAYAEGEYRDFDFDYGEKDRLLEHFDERRRLGERLELWKVQLSGQAMEGARNTVGMAFLYSRRAPDLEPGLGGPESLVSGKGSIDCERQTIFRWVASMEMVGGEELDIPPAPWVISGVTDEVFCKEPPGWKPGKSVLACT